ncbi:MAG: DMT family transporter [Pseudomonadota bacterium]
MQPKSSDYMIGVALVIVAAITYSTAGVFTKGVAAGSWDVIFWRGVFAAGFTTVWTLQQGTFQQNYFAMGRPGWAVAIVGAIGTAAFIPAFKLTSIANVSLIYAAAPLVAALLAWIAIGERLSRQTAIGCLAAFAGVGIIVSGSLGGTNLTGDILALIMTLAMSLIMVIYRVFPNTPGGGPTAMQSVLLLPVALFFGSPFAVPLAEIAILAAFGLLFAIAAVTLAEGAKRVPSGQTALLSALETPLAPLLAFMIFAELPGGLTWIGGSVIFAAVLFAILRAPDANS